MREYTVLVETDSLAGLSHSLVKYVITNTGDLLVSQCLARQRRSALTKAPVVVMVKPIYGRSGTGF
jgi:hypothetical protein